MGVSVTVQKRVLKFTENEKTVYVAKAQRGDVICPTRLQNMWLRTQVPLRHK